MLHINDSMQQPPFAATNYKILPLLLGLANRNVSRFHLTKLLAPPATSFLYTYLETRLPFVRSLMAAAAVRPPSGSVTNTNVAGIAARHSVISHRIDDLWRYSAAVSLLPFIPAGCWLAMAAATNVIAHLLWCQSP